MEKFLNLYLDIFTFYIEKVLFITFSACVHTLNSPLIHLLNRLENIVYIFHQWKDIIFCTISYMLYSKLVESEDYRMVWVGRNIERSSRPTSLPWYGTSWIRLGCSRSHVTLRWRLSVMMINNFSGQSFPSTL